MLVQHDPSIFNLNNSWNVVKLTPCLDVKVLQQLKKILVLELRLRFVFLSRFEFFAKNSLCRFSSFIHRFYSFFSCSPLSTTIIIAIGNLFQRNGFGNGRDLVFACHRSRPPKFPSEFLFPDKKFRLEIQLPNQAY